MGFFGKFIVGYLTLFSEKKREEKWNDEGKTDIENMLYWKSQAWDYLVTGRVKGGKGYKTIEKALYYYSKCLELEPNNYIIWARKGETFADLNRYDEAIQCFDKALDLIHSGIRLDNNIWTGHDENMGREYNIISLKSKTLKAKASHVCKTNLFDAENIFKDAILYSEKSARLLRKDEYRIEIERAREFIHIGNLFNNSGIYNKAISYYGEAMNIVSRQLSLTRESAERDLGIRAVAIKKKIAEEKLKGR